ncbi:glycoside hydrolase [Muricauda sp. JGD-17]|uniref:Glycoside hydrolase n=1 Tax=Flagellimonas ochracea TaxID=2696472 RepID=A0A964WW54_9FLAO|nr:trehalase family glycosidase [Allomuricauda ochracea]NAY90671.1 glycoside hydrolase [Allomuricauda ochracea]
MAKKPHSKIEQAKIVLEKNWQGSFTIPCEGLYPFQWNWDSGFIALGWAHINMDRAKQEIRSLLSGQWKNGFIPHILFHNESDSYFPGPEVHASYLSPHSPALKTSGITQPPVLGFVLEECFKISHNEELDFVREVFDAIYHNHHYFYTNRDPKNEGLVYICHNWEAGTDNTPVWDEIWKDLESPEYQLDRRDTKHVDASNRPSNREYQHYIHLIELFKSWKYDDGLIASNGPFLIQDPLFNAMLIKSNESLINLGNLLEKKEQVSQLRRWQQKAKESFNKKLYSKELGTYVYYDLRNERHLNYVSSSSFAPLFAGVPNQEIAEEMVRWYFEKGTFSGNKGQFLLCASFDPKSTSFDPKRYWRGPVWINLNWIIYRGLLRYGMKDVAEKIKHDTMYVLNKFGFYEYFDPRKEVLNTLDKGYGGNNFSWSAALYIDMLKNTNL